MPALIALIRRVVPLMRASGNHQWDDDYPNEEVFSRDIARGELWVAEIDSAIAGVAAITTEQEPEYAQADWDAAAPAMVVHRLAVDPANRSAGIAVGLMLHAEEVARQHAFSFVRVDTNTENPATLRLIPKLGYRAAGEITLAFRPGLRFLCYEKCVAPAASQSGVHLAAIALGSNLTSQFGDRAANLREAVSRISALGHIRAVSKFYSTVPVGYTDQHDFLNAALLLETRSSPFDLIRALLAIEMAMGRDRATAPAKGPRIVDLDLLLMDASVVNTPELTLPHPAMADRRFVLEPLAEIAAAMVHPISGQTIATLLTQLEALQS